MNESITLNAYRLNYNNIVYNATKSKGKAYVYLKTRMLSNDIFYVNGAPHIKYYIVKFSDLKMHSFKYEIKRLDKYPITEFDLKTILKAKSKIYIKGHN